jgi:hypothetical protein
MLTTENTRIRLYLILFCARYDAETMLCLLATGQLIIWSPQRAKITTIGECQDILHTLKGQLHEFSFHPFIFKKDVHYNLKIS